VVAATVLLVEDERKMRELVRPCLEPTGCIVLGLPEVPGRP
jgi:CheY-like chemotaxis protein